MNKKIYRRWFSLAGRQFNIELSLGTSLCMVEVSRRWDELVFAFALWRLFAVFIVIHGFHDLDRTLKISLHNGAIWWNLWTPDMEWSSKTPRYRNGNFDPVEFIFGYPKHSRKDIESFPAVPIDMPEGLYTASITLYESTWKRPRWPFSRRLRRADIEIESGIPIPGKGENSWDLDNDAVFGLTCRSESLDDAVSALKQNLLKDRGGWTPEPKHGTD